MTPEPEARPATIRVLVVEDEVLTRMVLAEELRDAGLLVVEAASADEALAWLTAGGHADLVFSDIRMPGSIDGLELARQLRVLHPGLPIILASANQSPAGLGLFIAKPYSMERAVSFVFKTLGLNWPRGAP